MENECGEDDECNRFKNNIYSWLSLTSTLFGLDGRRIQSNTTLLSRMIKNIF